jgi:hypothetical protein
LERQKLPPALNDSLGPLLIDCLPPSQLALKQGNEDADDRDQGE